MFWCICGVTGRARSIMSTRERRTTSSEEATKPKPLYRAPRLGESYQCYVPPVEGSKANVSVATAAESVLKRGVRWPETRDLGKSG